jgi:hypothetical protein
MSSLKRIVCLANSWKHEERCIAGIDLETGKWIRPVCDRLHPADGKIPKSVRLIDGKEPQLLEILGIPLDDTGDDFGFACENRSILPGPWQRLGHLHPTDLIDYCQDFPQILHTSTNFVQPAWLKTRPLPQRRTLQLVEVEHFAISESTLGSQGWRGILKTTSGQLLKGAKITDPVFAKKLGLGHPLPDRCFTTISLSMPWTFGDQTPGDAVCWKLIAGVIEL